MRFCGCVGICGALADVLCVRQISRSCRLLRARWRCWAMGEEAGDMVCFGGVDCLGKARWLEGHAGIGRLYLFLAGLGDLQTGWVARRMMA